MLTSPKNRNIGDISPIFFDILFFGHGYFLAIELPRISTNWPQLHSCNPRLIHLVSPPSEISLVLDISNSLSLFD